MPINNVVGERKLGTSTGGRRGGYEGGGGAVRTRECGGSRDEAEVEYRQRQVSSSPAVSEATPAVGTFVS